MTLPSILKTTAFYALVAVIMVISVFPFYYAILTSLKSGSALFQVNYWPREFSLTNYSFVIGNGTFLRNLGNSLLVASSVVILSLFWRSPRPMRLLASASGAAHCCCSPFCRFRCSRRLPFSPACLN